MWKDLQYTLVNKCMHVYTVYVCTLYSVRKLSVLCCMLYLILYVCIYFITFKYIYL